MRVKERRYVILRDLVELYIKKGKPVSSRELVEEYGYPWCSATVRNDLAALEREGYIYKPFPSSGRIPTAKGFRFYANWILKAAGLKGLDDEKALEGLEYLIAGYSAQGLWKAAASFIAFMVSQVGFLIPPDVEELKIVRAVLVRNGERDVTLHLFTEGGFSGEYSIELSRPVEEAELREAEEGLEELLKGRSLKEVEGGIRERLVVGGGRIGELVGEILGSLGSGRRRIYMAGLENLAEAIKRGRDAKALLKFLGDERAFMELVLGSRPCGEGIQVRVGDLPAEGLEDFALICSGFYRGLGVLGTFGPVWLDYARAIATVELVARLLSHPEAVSAFRGQPQ
ncbi:TPA: hypothetical protein EYP13_03120 [Candidatus Micrarchaeota archaeon]|nr:hypothetical protein [Candidatus Micrarchaeota archaeon]